MPVTTKEGKPILVSPHNIWEEIFFLPETPAFEYKDNAGTFCSRSSSPLPLLYYPSSSDVTPDIRQSDIWENDELLPNSKNGNLPDTWLATESMDLDSVGDFRSLFVMPRPLDDEACILYSGPKTLDNTATSLSKTVGPVISNLSAFVDSSQDDQRYRYSGNDQIETKMTKGRYIKRENMPPPTVGGDTNHSIVRLGALESALQLDIHTGSSSKRQENQSLETCSDDLKAGRDASGEIKGGEKEVNRPQISDALLESVEISSQETDPDHFSSKPAKHKQLLRPQRDFMIGMGERDESEYSTCGVESDEEARWSRSGSSEIEDTQLENSQTIDADRFLNDALIEVKDMLLQELLNHAASEPTDGSEGSESRKRTRNSSSSFLSSSSSNPSGQPLQKRLRGGGRNPGDDGESDEDKNEKDKPPNSNGKPPLSAFPVRRLKCPFNQRQPEKYVRAACRGGGFADMAKLKDHIKRVHSQPLRCLRCWEEMESDETYAIHLQAEVSCKKQQEPIDDRLPYQMLRRLDFKKAPYAKAKNTEQKWKILYSILFPDDDEIPSPYYYHSFTPRLQKILHDALEEELILKMAPAMEPIMLQIKQSIPAIIRNCKSRLSQVKSDSGAPYTPSSLAALSSTDSEREGWRHQLASPRDSEKSVSKSLSHAVFNEEPPPPESSSSSDSSSNGVQGSCHVSLSPGSIVDLLAMAPSHGCEMQETSAYIWNGEVPDFDSYTFESSHLEGLSNFPESFNNTYPTMSTSDNSNCPATTNSKPAQQNELSFLNFIPPNNSKNPQPLDSHTTLSPQLNDNSYMAPGDYNTYSNLEPAPISSEFDSFGDIDDLDHFLG